MKLYKRKFKLKLVKDSNFAVTSLKTKRSLAN